MSRFYHFSQNNSGGSFDFDAAAGITHHVVIEANNREHACDRAESIGLYFDGCDDGRDCECCGDRWSRPWGDGDDAPLVYGSDALAYGKDHFGIKWMGENAEVFVHYLDGRIVGGA